MTKIEIIKEQELLGKEFRIYGSVENPLFLAKEVTDWIDYSGRTGQLLNTVDEDEKLTHTIYASGQNREMWFLTEDGVYEVLMQSRKPIAKEFKKKVKEILKSIRKTGGYVGNEDTFVNTYLPFADDNTKALFKMTLQTVREQNEVINKQNKQLIEQKPMVTFAERCLKSKDSILVRQLAKIITNEGYKIGQNKLYDKLREWGLILKGSTEPSQTAMNKGYFEVIQRPVETAYGEMLSRTSKVTPKGQVYIVERLVSESEELLA